MKRTYMRGNSEPGGAIEDRRDSKIIGSYQSPFTGIMLGGSCKADSAVYVKHDAVLA
jgi:hypothetical protein